MKKYATEVLDRMQCGDIGAYGAKYVHLLVRRKINLSCFKLPADPSLSLSGDLSNTSRKQSNNWTSSAADNAFQLLLLSVACDHHDIYRAEPE